MVTKEEIVAEVVSLPVGMSVLDEETDLLEGLLERIVMDMLAAPEPQSEDD